MSLHFTSLHITSHYITSHHFTSHHFTSLHITSHHFTSLHFTSLHITSLHITSYDIMVISDIMGHVGVMLWHLKGHRGDLLVRLAWSLHESCMITAWGLHDLGGSIFDTFSEAPFWRPKWGNMCQKGAKKVPKSIQKVTIFWKMKTSILTAIYYTLATLTPPKAFPKLMRKSDPTKVDQKDTNTHNIVPKWSQNGLPHFPGFA